MESRVSARMAGVVAGVVLGLLGLGFPVAAWALGPVLLLVLLLRPPRIAALGVFFMAFGGTWAILLLRAQLDCAVNDLLPGRECIGPALETWYAIAFASLGLGILLSVGAARRRSGHEA
jgi:hypothetical protein